MSIDDINVCIFCEKEEPIRKVDNVKVKGGLL